MKRVGDDARAFRLRSWGKVPSTIDVGVARTGNLVVTTVVRSRGRAVADKAALTGLAAAVNGLCGTDGAGRCAGRARADTTSPLAIGTPPGLLSVVDLPPVAAVRGPWVGIKPQRPRQNYAATRCDRTSFQGKGISRALTRNFLFPETPDADQLGLTQTVGSMQRARASKFVDQVRERMRQCGRANLGTSVTELASSFAFLMAIVRDDSAVSQLGFTPIRKMTMSRSDFVALSRRVLERLGPLAEAG